MAKKKTIEERFQEMDEITHILSRSGMYVGSTKLEEAQKFVYDNSENKMTIKDVTYVPAMLKIFDEVLSNSCDEFRRSTNMGLTEVSVKIWKNGKIIVRDNGGIPVVVHKTAKCYVPEFIFGRLRTSSNYDDTEDRQLIGTNGVGSALSNVFSKKFTIDCADKKKSFHRSWVNNMRTLDNDLEIKPSKEHYTQTTFEVDFDKFDIKDKEFSDDFIDMVEKRCIDASCANIGLTVNFEYVGNRKSTWAFKNFEQYINLFSELVDLDGVIKYEDQDKKIWIYPDSDINVGFVDGAECSKGTHIRGIRNPINEAVVNYLKTKNKIEVTTRGVDNKYSLFCVVNVTNPAYNSQTKEELTTPIDKFSPRKDFSFDIPKTFIDGILKSDIINTVLDWYKQKTEAEDARTIRKLNKDAKKVLRSEKFIDCTSNRTSEKQLWLFEGDSAKSGFRISRDPKTQGAYLLRGNPLNTMGLTPTQIMKNNEFSDIFNILGLQWGQKNDPKKLKFGKIVICSDMDADGSKIASLLLVFFNHFPELFESKMICRSISPIIIANKGKDTKKYYTLDEYRKVQKSLKGYNIRYIKGLGGMENCDYKEMMRTPIFHTFAKDRTTDMMLKKWFSKGIATERKQMLKKDVEANE